MTAPLAYPKFTPEMADAYMIGKETHPIRAEIGLRAGALEVWDLGCGKGYLTPRFNPSTYRGLDCSEALLEIAKRNHPGYQFELHDLNRPLRREDESVECAIVLSVLEHQAAPEDGLFIFREAARIARTLIMGWNTPPRGSEFGVRSFREPGIDLDQFVVQYPRDYFDDPALRVRHEPFGDCEIWTVTHR